MDISILNTRSNTKVVSTRRKTDVKKEGILHQKIDQKSVIVIPKTKHIEGLWNLKSNIFV